MNGIAGAAVIDVHAHAVLDATMGAAGRYGPEIGAAEDGTPLFRVGDYRLIGVRYRGSAFMEPEIRLRQMDAAGIDFQLLSPNPLTYFSHIAAPEAIAFCRVHNDALADAVARRPDRLAGLAALPTQDLGAAVEELHRAVADLGLWGAMIGTDNTEPLHAPAFDPLYAACVKLDVPLFIHPAPAGLDGPAGDPNLKRFDLDLVAGFASQETIAAATLVFGQVLERHPTLDVCVSHGGGAIAFLAGRLAQAARKRPWVPASLKADGAFEAMLSRIWFDTHVNDDLSLELLERRVGPDRLVYGTNFAGWDAPDRAHHAAPAPRLADNARRLLRKPAA